MKKRVVISIALLILALSCVGNRLVLLTFQQTIVFRVYDEPQFFAIDYSPDGSSLVVGASRETRIYDLLTDEAPLYIPDNGPFGGAHGAVYSPDGGRIAVPFGDVVRIWDSSTVETMSTIDTRSGTVLSVLYSPDGSSIVTTSSEPVVQVWDAATGELITEIETSSCGFYCNARYSPDGQKIISGRADGTVRVWSVETSSELLDIHASAEEEVRESFFSPDGSRIVTLTEDELMVWDAYSGQSIAVIQHPLIKHYRSMAQSPDGRYVAVLNWTGLLIVWNLDTERVVHIYPGLLVESNWGGAVDVAFSPDGKQIAVSGDKQLEIVEAYY